MRMRNLTIDIILTRLRITTATMDSISTTNTFHIPS